MKSGAVLFNRRLGTFRFTRNSTFINGLQGSAGRFTIAPVMHRTLPRSIVPRCPVLEQRIGQQVSARLRGDHFPWSFGGNHAFPDSQTGLTCLHRSRLSQFGQKWPSGIVSFEIHESEVR